ncbi:hypothetical protein QTN25_004801 [Entamoeba marina]
MALPIYKNISDDVQLFESKQEFEKYYNKHQDDVDTMSTREVEPGKLMFIPSVKNNIDTTATTNVERSRDQGVNTADIKNDLAEIKHMLQHIMKHMPVKPKATFDNYF